MEQKCMGQQSIDEGMMRRAQVTLKNGTEKSSSYT